jgi:hypothetical protein
MHCEMNKINKIIMEPTNNSTSDPNTEKQNVKDHKTFNILSWFLLHFITFPLALSLGFGSMYLFAFINPQNIQDGLAYIVNAIIVGGMIGLIQWILLKNILNISSTWIWRSLLGFGLAETLVVIVLLFFNINRNMGFNSGYGAHVNIIMVLMGGTIAGYLQSLTLKKVTSFYRAWIWGSILSWGLSAFICDSLIVFFNLNVVSVLTGGLVFSLVFVIFIRYILKKRISDHQFWFRFRTLICITTSKHHKENQLSGDSLVMDIRQTIHFLGEITEEITTEDMLGNIFSKFCIGNKMTNNKEQNTNKSQKSNIKVSSDISYTSLFVIYPEVYGI